jgi:hypothetical protein
MAAALAVALSGCGSVMEPEAADPQAADTWRFEMVRSTVPDDPAELRFAGVFDHDRQLGRLLIMDDEEAWAYTKCEVETSRIYPEEMRVFSGLSFSRWETWGESYWIEEKHYPVLWSYGEFLRVFAPYPAGQVAPADVLERLRAYSDEFLRLGSVEVETIETTHYKASIDLGRLVGRLPEGERPPEEVADWWRRYDRGPISVEAWVDAEGRLRRMRAEINVEGLGELGDVMTNTLELYDYGVPVDVEAPKELTTMEEYYKRSEEGWPADDRCESPSYRLRPEEEEE